MKAVLAAVAVAGVGMVSLALAQDPSMTPPLPPGYVADAQSTYDPAEVASARSSYRQECQRHGSANFCDCMASGMAQALPPRLVNQARSGMGDRLSEERPEGSTGYRADARTGVDDPEYRIAEVERHYADACRQFR